jgi:hypothetical protein
VTVLLGDGAGNLANGFSATGAEATNGGPMVVADVTGDGKADLVLVSTNGGRSSLNVFASSATSFAAPVSIGVPGQQVVDVGHARLKGAVKRDLLVLTQPAEGSPAPFPPGFATVTVNP